MAVCIKFTAKVEHRDFVVEIRPALIALLIWRQLVFKSDLNCHLLAWSQQDILGIFSRIEKTVKLNFQVDALLIFDGLGDRRLHDLTVLCFISNIWVVII